MTATGAAGATATTGTAATWAPWPSPVLATRPDQPLMTMVRRVVADHLPGRMTRTAVIAMSRDDNPKATVMVFTDDAATPELVVKVALTAEASRSVSAEAMALLTLERLDPGRIGGTVPRCLEVRHGAGRTALVMSARPGVPLAIGYHRWRHTSRPNLVRRDFTCAAGWLRSLSRLTVPRVPEPDRSGLLRRRWPGDPVALAAARTVERLGAVLDHDGPGSVCHGDFWCGNVLQTDGIASGVVDWEHAGFGGDSLRDWTRFALSYSLYLDRHTHAGTPVHGHEGLVARRPGDGVRYAMQQQGWYPRLVRQFVGDALVASGRPPGLWREAMLLGLGEIAATSDHDGFARQHLELLEELTR